jgi:hypothetical protein
MMRVSPGTIKSITWLWQRKEALIWISALVFLAVSDPAVHHYTLCPLDNLGFSYCPGCGLGRSIGYFFRFEMESSFYSHPLGIPAVILLVYRSVKILFRPSVFNLSTL